jgi:solute carrier family 25 protein 16
MPTPELRTPGRLFLAGSLSGPFFCLVVIRSRADVVSVLFLGVTSVFMTYPLELIRVRLAYQTNRQPLIDVVKTIYRENHPLTTSSSSTGSSSTAASTLTTSSSSPLLTSRIPILNHFIPFYRGFSVTVIGMIPYAGVSFLTYGTLVRHIPRYFPSLAGHKTWSDLACGAVAGAVSQTASYPFEVIRRRMQVGGIRSPGGVGLTWKETVRTIWKEGKGKVGRGFFVGLSIGYIKVIPMTA